jgi:hypothetical protein
MAGGGHTAAAVAAAAAAAANRASAAGVPPEQQQQQQQPQDFDSWRHQQHQAAPPGYNLASDLYGFYQQNPFHHYTGFGVGGEGTWSNGDHMTFLSGYGTQLPGTEAQFGMDTAIFGAGAGGFGAFTQAPGYGFDFTGSAAAGYSQWGNQAAAAGRAAAQQGHAGAAQQAPADQQQQQQWGQQRAAQGEQQQQQYYRPEHYAQEGRGRVAAAEQAMQGLHIGGSNHTQDIKFQESKTEGKDGASKQQHSDSSGGGGSGPTSLAPPAPTSGGGGGGSNGGQPKKMSWASVASQPAKPATTIKPKKPGVLSPPQLPATNKPLSGAASAAVPPNSVEIGTWDHTATSAVHHHHHQQQNGGGIPTPASLMGMPPPLPGIGHHHQPVISTSYGGHMPPASRGMMTAAGGPMGRGNGGAWMGGRAGGGALAGVGGGPMGPPVSVMSNGLSPHGGLMAGAIHHHHPSVGGGMPVAAHPTQHPPPSASTAASNAAAVSPGDACVVLDELKATNTYNPREFDINPVGARFFVVKSYSEDDIHRSIKYEIWCSTEHGNKRLDSAFREREGKGPIYLFYSVNGSGHFCGMAQMLSGVDYSTTSKVWAQDKWKGKFQVRWIYVKDVPNQQLRHIKLENNENKPVTNSRDTQEVPHEKGKMVLKILVSYKHATSIFDDFSHYEKRQEEEEERKPPPHQNGRGDRHDSHHSSSHRRGGGGDHYHNNNRDDGGEYRGRGHHGGGGDYREDRRRDRDGEDGGGGGGRGGYRGGGRGRGGGYYDKGRGNYHSGGGHGGGNGPPMRRSSPVQKDGATANGGK